MRAAYEFANGLITQASYIAFQEASRDGRGITEGTVEEVAYWSAPFYNATYNDHLVELRTQIQFLNAANSNGWTFPRKMNDYAKLDYLKGKGFEQALRDIARVANEQPMPLRTIKRNLAHFGFVWKKHHTFRDHLLSSGLVEPSGEHGYYRII